jgi:hypothetical protein
MNLDTRPVLKPLRLFPVLSAYRPLLRLAQVEAGFQTNGQLYGVYKFRAALGEAAVTKQLPS